MSAKIIDIQARLQVKRDRLIFNKMAQLQPAFDRVDNSVVKAIRKVEAVKEILEDEGTCHAKLLEIRSIIYGE